MIVIPEDPDVHGCVEGLNPSGAAEEAAFFQCSVDCETNRGASAGSYDVELVDLPWNVIDSFFPGTFLKQPRFKDAEVIQLGGETAVRPNRDSVYAAVDAWIQGTMDPNSAAEYQTAEEEILPDEEPALEDLEPQFLVPGDSGDEHAALRQRVIELEAQLRMREVPSSPIPAASTRPSALRPKAPPMFPSESQQVLDAAQLQKLQRLAGVPPPRVSFQETRRKELPPPVLEQDNLYAELEKEAAEVAAVELGAQAAASSQDPLQQILLTQLQQNSILLKKLVAPRHQDPIVGLLSGANDGASGSGSGPGVKGCLAREAFIRTSTDLEQMQLVVRRNALLELGYTPDREDGALLRKYMERRMPLAEHKTLAYLSTLVAEGWAVGYASANTELLGVLAKMMIFLEQCALDGGKLQMAWLLTGHQEPAWQLLTNHRRRPGLQPFSRLAAPAWVSANIAYLRELDFMESRMSSLSKLGGPEKPEKDPDAAKPKPKPKAKKGTGKGSKSEPKEDPE